MSADATLIQITEAALASAYARAGTGSGLVRGQWMACHPGCHQCCIGVFAISTLDATRLRDALTQSPPDLQQRIHTRAQASRARLTPNLPGDPTTGTLFTEPHHEDAFEDFANDEPCPVLDPATGTCDLYAARPMTCRTFGPPMPNDEEGLAVCELCFVDAPTEEVARCAVDPAFLLLEEQTLAAHEALTQPSGQTLIAFAITA